MKPEQMAAPRALRDLAAVRHIAVILHDFSTGGSERIAIRLANRWAACGRRVTILSGVAAGPARALVAANVTVRIASPELSRGPVSRFILGGTFARMLASDMPDLIFSPGNFHLPVIGALARRLGLRRPAIVCKISNPLRQPGRGGASQWLFDRLVRRTTHEVDAFVAMSVALRDEAAAVLRRPGIVLIHEPILDGPAAQDLRFSHSRRQPPLIVCAGRLEPQKHFTLAIRAFARLDPAWHARLLILGEGYERAELEAEAKWLAVADRVAFGGHVADIRPALASARLFLMSSRYEGYPAVLIEALAAGLPIVTTDCTPALGEIMVHPSFGRVTPPDADALARAIEMVLDGALPDAQSTTDLLARHRIAEAADHYLALFDDVVAAFPARDHRVPIC